MERIPAEWIAYGLDSATAQAISRRYTLSQLRKLDADALRALGLPEPAIQQLLHPARTPIPQKTVEEVLVRSGFTCCICHQPGLPVVIHHIDKWEHSHSHDPDNLAVLCLNHHGEAHTHHENARNLTPRMIRNARENWYALLEDRKREAETAVANLRHYRGRWDYLNLSYLCGFLDDRKIRVDGPYREALVEKGLLTEGGAIRSDRLTVNATHWLDFFDGMYLKRYLEEMVDTLLSILPVRYIREARQILEPFRPGELLLIDGRTFFRRMNRRARGIGQTRRVRCTLGSTRFTGEFDAWYCLSSSAHSTHLTGSKDATLLCLVRSVDRVDGVDQVDCTVVGLGLNLTQPDLMAQLLRPSRGGIVLDTGAARTAAYERELDRIADLRRGLEQAVFLEQPPRTCDLCKTSFQTQKYLIDGETKERGAWARMCPECYREHGVGIQWGTGQLYRRWNGQWLLVGGFAEDDDGELDAELFRQWLEHTFQPPDEP